MIVDVLYEGLTLAKGVEARVESDAVFVDLDSPMPVGTRLIVRSPDGEKHARVESVAETGKFGVLVRYGKAPATTETPVTVPAPPSASASAPVPPSAPGATDEQKNGESDDDKEPPKGGRKRRNTRKTVLGH